MKTYINPNRVLRQLNLENKRLALFSSLPLSNQRIYFNIARTKQISPTQACYKTQATLGAQSGFHLDTAHRGVKRLKSLGFLQTQWRGYKKSLIYIPLFVPDMVKLLTLLTIRMAAAITDFHMRAVQTNIDIHFSLKQTLPNKHLVGILGGVPPDIPESGHVNVLTPQIIAILGG